MRGSRIVNGLPSNRGPATPGELAFIDGAQQVEAWLTGSRPRARLTALPGAAFAIAAGAVVAHLRGARARIEGVSRGHAGTC